MKQETFVNTKRFKEQKRGGKWIGGFFIIMANLLVDLGYGLLDPRVRFE